VVTYSTLVSKAESYAEAVRLLEEMKAAGIAPDAVTYNTLVSKAGSYAEAVRLLEEMKAAGIAPNVVTYNTLVSKAGSYAEAVRLLEEMKAAGIAPNDATYCSLLAKPIDGTSAHEVLDWYYREAYDSSEPLNALIGSFRRSKRIADALEVALERPYLSAARRLMRERPEQAQQRFERAKNEAPNHPTADFALGALYFETRDTATARLYLQSALQTACDPRDKNTIQKWLEELEDSG
jgi:pentatricopeptide repeat protein